MTAALWASEPLPPCVPSSARSAPPAPRPVVIVEAPRASAPPPRAPAPTSQEPTVGERQAALIAERRPLKPPKRRGGDDPWPLWERT